MGHWMRAAGRPWSLHERTLVLGLDQFHHEVIRTRERDNLQEIKREAPQVYVWLDFLWMNHRVQLQIYTQFIFTLQEKGKNLLNIFYFLLLGYFDCFSYIEYMAIPSLLAREGTPNISCYFSSLELLSDMHSVFCTHTLKKGNLLSRYHSNL